MACLDYAVIDGLLQVSRIGFHTHTQNLSPRLLLSYESHQQFACLDSASSSTSGEINTHNHFLQRCRYIEMDEKSVAVVNQVISNHIPEDLTFSILSKLPLKSLKRFGCVHKSCTLLFENSHFMSMYRKNFTNTSLLLKQCAPDEEHHTWLYLQSGESVENRVSLESPSPFEDGNSFIIVLGSSANGVICFFNNDDIPVLWNPATKEFKVIPHSPIEFGPLYREPWSNLCGFGYDHVRDDYKVIRYVVFFLLTAGEADRYGMPYYGPWDENLDSTPLWEIYSLRSNSWKKLDFKMPTPCHSIVGGRAYSEGVCHWWGQKEYRGVMCLVSFDMSNEVFFTTPMPSYMGDASFDISSMEMHLAVLNGYAAFICNHTEKTTFHISILGELGVKESWTKLFVIGPFPCVENLIGAGNNGDIFFKTKDGELGWFDWSTQIIVELGIKDPEEYSQVVIYKENFESLIHIGLLK